MNAVKQEETDHIDLDVKIEYLMDIKREEGYFDDLNDDDGGDDVGGGDVVVKEEEVEEVVEEVVVGVKRKAAEKTKPRKTKKKRIGRGFVWTEEEDEALLKGASKYGLDFKQIKEDDGKVLADRNPENLYQRLYKQFPEKYKELRAGKGAGNHFAWTAEQDAALKRGMKKYGNNWVKIISDNDVLKRRSAEALKYRYSTHLK